MTTLSKFETKFQINNKSDRQVFPGSPSLLLCKNTHYLDSLCGRLYMLGHKRCINSELPKVSYVKYDFILTPIGICLCGARLG